MRTIDKAAVVFFAIFALVIGFAWLRGWSFSAPPSHSAFECRCCSNCQGQCKCRTVKENKKPIGPMPELY